MARHRVAKALCISREQQQHLFSTLVKEYGQSKQTIAHNPKGGVAQPFFFVSEIFGFFFSQDNIERKKITFIFCDERKREKKKPPTTMSVENASGRTTVLYHSDCTWEIDYVFKELLRDVMARARVLYLTSDKLAAYNEKHPNDRRVVVFSSSTISFEKMQRMMQDFKPHVTFHFSDEFGTRPEYCQLADLTGVFFHQHTFASYPKLQNMVQIPLGFKIGFAYDWKHHKPITERKLQWSFVGTIKANSNRTKMLEVFKRRLPDNFNAQTTGNVSTSDMGAIYADSVFVPNDRGDVRLDCFRLYEAIFAGAIPVLAGDSKEMQETFYFAGPEDFPPFVIADTWSKVAKICVQLLQPENVQKLQELQQANRKWLHKHLNQVRKRVVEVVNP